MSWGEVCKINNNMKKSLNEQMRDMKFQPVRIITETGTYKPEKTGLYKIICVGAGGNGGYKNNSSNYGGAGGGGGGVAIKTMKLSSSVNYSVTVGTTASFAYSGGAITATSGVAPTETNVATGEGGTASGGDYNFKGTLGGCTGNKVEYIAPKPGSVGVFISGLSQTSHSISHFLNDILVEYPYGDSILGYGGGGSGAGYWTSSSNSGGHSKNGQPAAVIIIPIEMEE